MIPRIQKKKRQEKERKKKHGSKLAFRTDSGVDVVHDVDVDVVQDNAVGVNRRAKRERLRKEGRKKKEKERKREKEKKKEKKSHLPETSYTIFPKIIPFSVEETLIFAQIEIQSLGPIVYVCNLSTNFKSPTVDN